MSDPRPGARPGEADAYDGDAYFDDEHADSTGPTASPLTMLADAGSRTAKAARTQTRGKARAAKGPRREQGEGSVAEPVTISTTMSADDLAQETERPLRSVDGPSSPRPTRASAPEPRSGSGRERRGRSPGSPSRSGREPEGAGRRDPGPTRTGTGRGGGGGNNEEKTDKKK